jgi:hypothetical protein
MRIRITGRSWEVYGPNFLEGSVITLLIKILILIYSSPINMVIKLTTTTGSLVKAGGARDGARIIFASDLARWQKPGDITDVPKADGVNVNNYLDGGSRWLEDGGFLRLRTLTIGYTIPKRITQKAKFENVRIYVVGSNLFLVTKYTGPDPESSANSSQNQPGIDLGTPPQPRSVQFGVSFSL